MQRLSTRLVWGATLFTTPGLKSGGFGLIHTLLRLAIVLGFLLIPLALYRRGSHRGPPDSDTGDGWGKPPKPPKPPPRGPQGGIPLDDATPARVRIRGGERLADMLPRRSRRGDREPERSPVRETRPR
jgi:hypothetical protein